MNHFLCSLSHLNGATVNDQSVTQTKHGRLEIMWTPSDRDLVDALEDPNFVNNVVRMEKRDPTSNDDHGASNHVGEETRIEKRFNGKCQRRHALAVPTKTQTKQVE